MPHWSPPSVPRHWLVGVGIVYALVALYSVIVVQQALVGAIFPLLFLGGGYLLWRLLRAVEAIAEALQRIADSHDDEEYP